MTAARPCWNADTRNGRSRKDISTETHTGERQNMNVMMTVLRHRFSQSRSASESPCNHHVYQYHSHVQVIGEFPRALEKAAFSTMLLSPTWVQEQRRNRDGRRQGENRSLHPPNVVPPSPCRPRISCPLQGSPFYRLQARAQTIGVDAQSIWAKKRRSVVPEDWAICLQLKFVGQTALAVAS